MKYIYSTSQMSKLSLTLCTFSITGLVASLFLTLPWFGCWTGVIFLCYLLISTYYCYCESWYCVFEVSGGSRTISIYQHIQVLSEVFQNFHKSCRPCVFVSILYVILVSTAVADENHIFKQNLLYGQIVRVKDKLWFD